MIWLGITIPILAFIGLYLIISGIVDIFHIIILRKIHKQIDALLKEEINEKRT